MIGPTTTRAALAPWTVRVSVFGGLRVSVDGAEVELGPVRQRSILALLVAARGDIVTTTEIVAALWPGKSPASALNQVQRHVGELRRLMEADLPARSTGSHLRAAGTGYRLDPAGLDSDLERFYSLVASGRKTGEHAAAAAALFEAARIAGGSPFVGLPDELLGRPVFAGVITDRLTVVCDAADAVGDSARATELLPLVEALAAEVPLDEHVQSTWIRLLGGVGRRADAFAAFERTRANLAEALGVDPGAELRSAQRELLDDDATHDVPAVDTPRFVPPLIGSFIDRSDVRPVFEHVADHAARAAGEIVVLSGMGGVGKTTLGIHWANEASAAFPDGQLYVNLLGYAPGGAALSSDAAMVLLLEQLGGDVSGDSATARAGTYRSLLSGKRMVLLLDNARDAEQVRPLLSGVSGCLTIVTSRDRLAGLIVREGARSVPLRRWTDDESRRLLVSRLGLARVQQDGAAIDSIIASCAGLPLALAITAARTVLQADTSMPAIARELSSRPRVLDSLAADESDNLRSTFEWSYRSLHPEAARMFRRLAAHPGPQMSLLSLATGADRSVAQARRSLGELVSASMVAQLASERYELHDLLRAYAGELLDRAAERRDAEERLIRHFVLSTRDAFLQFGRPPVAPLDVEAPFPESIERFDSMGATIDWYTTERSALKGMISRAYELGLDLECCALVLDWRPMNQTIDSAPESIASSLIGLDAARRLGDELLVAELGRDIGGKLARMGEYDRATSYLGVSLAAFVALGDAVGESNVYRNLANSASRFFDSAEVGYAQSSVEAARRSQDPASLANSLVCLGEAYKRSASRQEGIDAFAEAHKWAGVAKLSYLQPVIDIGLAEFECANGEFAEARRLALSAKALLIHDSDIVLSAALNAVIAQAGVELGLDDEVRLAVDVLDGLIAQYETLILEATLDMDAIERSREWLRARDIGSARVAG
jgi:DNA-binding SARP family transcriptional activator